MPKQKIILIVTKCHTTILFKQKDKASQILTMVSLLLSFFRLSCSWKKVGGLRRPPLKSVYRVRSLVWRPPPTYQRRCLHVLLRPSTCSRRSSCWTSCGRNACCRGQSLHRRWCQGGWHWSCSSQGSCAVRYPYPQSPCCLSWRQNVCRQSAPI